MAVSGLGSCSAHGCRLDIALEFQELAFLKYLLCVSHCDKISSFFSQAKLLPRCPVLRPKTQFCRKHSLEKLCKFLLTNSKEVAKPRVRHRQCGSKHCSLSDYAIPDEPLQAYWGLTACQCFTYTFSDTLITDVIVTYLLSCKHIAVLFLTLRIRSEIIPVFFW